MLSDEEYSAIQLFRIYIDNFARNGTYNGHGLSTLDSIMQKRGNKPCCQTCTGDVVNVLKDIIKLIKKYEEGRTANH